MDGLKPHPFQSERKVFAPAVYLTGSLLGVAATLLVATLSWEFFEKRLVHRGHKYRY